MEKPLEIQSDGALPQKASIHVWSIFRLVTGVAILGFLIWKTDFSQLIDVLARVDPFWLLVTLFIQIVAKFVWAWRWADLLAIYDIHVPILRLVRAIYVGLFFNNFLPTSVGGDFSRGYWILDDKQLYRKSLFIVFIERFIGFVHLAWITIFGFMVLILQGAVIGEVLLLGLIGVLLLGLSIVALNPYVFEFFNHLVFGLQSKFMASTREKIGKALAILHRTEHRARFTFLSLLVQLGGILIFYTVGQALRLEIGFWHYFVLVPLTVIATMLPISFNGLGIREGCLILFSVALGLNVTPSGAVALGLLVFAYGLLNSLIGGVFYIAGEKRYVPGE
jgi:uncharacterized protein (TIRG00374 family)